MEPTTEHSFKRFAPKQEGFAKERTTILQREVKELRQDYPEVLSFCLFGSLPRGQSRPDSDIDGYLFIDIDMAANRLGTNPATIQEDEESEYGGVLTTNLTKDIAAIYIDPFRKKLRDQLRLTQEQVEDIRSCPISQSIIDRHVNFIATSIKELQNFEIKEKEWLEIDDPLSEWDSGPERPPFPDAGINLKAMFHLEIGGGIAGYRAYLLNKLESMGDMGQLIWKVIIIDTEMMEQHFCANTPTTYPRSLAEAQKVYGKTKA